MWYPFLISAIVLASDQPGYGIPPVNCQKCTFRHPVLKILLEFQLFWIRNVIHLTYRLWNESLETETKLLRKLISWNVHSGHCIVMTYWQTITVILPWYVHQRDRATYSQYRSLMVEIVWSLSYVKFEMTVRYTEFKEMSPVLRKSVR